MTIDIAHMQRTSCKQYIKGSWARIEDNKCVLINLTKEYKLEYSGMLPLYTTPVRHEHMPNPRDGYSGSKGCISVPYFPVSQFPFPVLEVRDTLAYQEDTLPYSLVTWSLHPTMSAPTCSQHILLILIALP